MLKDITLNSANASTGVIASHLTNWKRYTIKFALFLDFRKFILKY